MPIRFRFSWMPFVATFIVVAIGIALGDWQTRRAVEKETIAARLQARSMAPVIELGNAELAADDNEFRQVRVKGHFVQHWPVYLDNRPHQGQAGFYLLMPLKISGTDKTVLVARGWLPRDIANRTRIPPVATPGTEIEITGMIRRHAGRLFELGTAMQLAPGAIVQNVTVAEFAAASKLAMHPFLIEQTSKVADGLVRDWPRPSHGADKHRGYAFQWYGLAATAFLFFVVTGFRRGTKQ